MYVYSRTFIENNYFNLSVNDDFNLVYPNVYIGNYSTSTNYQLLQNLGITHIISVIPSFNPPFADKFKYLHIEAYDDESQDIKKYFEISNEFINKCLKEGGKILIHCMVGRSRSVTIFLAFLIYIIQGNFNKNILNLEECNDIYNSIEYNKLIKEKKRQREYNSGDYDVNSYDGISNKNRKHDRYDDNSDNDLDNDLDKITKVAHIKPQLNNREKNFIIYKKENMLNDVDKLIYDYNILKKEISIKKKCKSDDDDGDDDNDNDNTYKTVNELNKIIKTMKKQSGNHFIIQILKYIKTYRKTAEPNSYFINQLSEYIFA